MATGSLGVRGFANYKAVWDTRVVPTFFRNSAIISGGVILLVYVFSMAAGFGFSKLCLSTRGLLLADPGGADPPGGDTADAPVRHTPEAADVQRLLFGGLPANGAANAFHDPADHKLPGRRAQRVDGSRAHRRDHQGHRDYGRPGTHSLGLSDAAGRGPRERAGEPSPQHNPNAGFPSIFKQEKGYKVYEYFDTAKSLGALLEVRERY